MKVYLGQGGRSDDNIQVTIGDVWTFDPDTHTYTQGAASNVKSSKAGSGDACSCSNYLKEIDYKVKLEVKDVPNSASTAGTALKKYFAPKEIVANLILGKKVDGTCTTKTGVEQKFSVSFSSNEGTEIEQKRSGNPGYLEGYPLKLGSIDAANAAVGAPVNVFMDGFQVTGADAIGSCLKQATAQSDTAVIDYNDPVINYKQDLTYGCSNAWNKASLKDMCGKNTADYFKSFEMIKNLDNL